MPLVAVQPVEWALQVKVCPLRSSCAQGVAELQRCREAWLQRLRPVVVLSPVR